MGEENASSNTNSPFSIEYGERDGVLVARFHGRIGSREVPELEKWANEIYGKGQKIFLIDFTNVSTCMPATFVFFVNFQKKLRDSGKLIGLCGMSKEIKTALLMGGTIRENEIYENLPLAWQHLEPKLHEESSNSSNPGEEAA